MFYNQREEVGRAQALYGEGCLRVRTPGSGRLQAYGVSPYEAGPRCLTFFEDPDEPYRVTQAVFYFIRDGWVWAQHMTAHELTLYKLARTDSSLYPHTINAAGAAALAGVSGDFLAGAERAKTQENPWGVVPVYSFLNGAGASDLFPMLNAQDSLNKSIYNLESAAEYHGFPLLEVRGYAGQRDDEGLPTELDVGPGSYVLVDEKGGLKRLDAADLTQLLAAEARGYLRVAQQGRSPAVLMEYKGLGDSGRVPSFLLEPLKMRLNSKKSGAIQPLELLARDLVRYGVTGAVDLDEYDVEVDIKMPLPSDKIGEEEARSRAVEVGSMSRQAAARLRGEDPTQHLSEWEQELRIQEGVKAEFAPKPAGPKLIK